MTDEMDTFTLPPTPTRPGTERGGYGGQEQGTDTMLNSDEHMLVEGRVEGLNDLDAPVNCTSLDEWLGRSMGANEVTPSCSPPMYATPVASQAVAAHNMVTPPANWISREYAHITNGEMVPGEIVEIRRLSQTTIGGLNGHFANVASGGAVLIAPRPDPSPVGVEEALFSSTAPCTPQMGTSGCGEREMGKAKCGKTEGEVDPEPLRLDEVAGILSNQELESIVDNVEKRVHGVAESAKLRLREQLKKDGVPANSRESRVTRRKQWALSRAYRNLAFVLLEHLYRQQWDGGDEMR